MSAAKWEVGRCINSLDDMLAQERIFWRPRASIKNQVVVRRFFSAWSLRYANREVQNGKCFTAVPVANKEEE